VREFHLLLPLLRRRRGRYLVGGAAILAAVFLRVVVPHLVGRSIDLLRTGGSPSGLADGQPVGPLLARAALEIVLFALAGGLVRTTSRILILGASRHAVHDLRERVFAHLLRLPPSFYERQRSGDLMSRCVNDVRNVQALCGPVILYLAETVALYAVCLSMMLRISVSLTLLCILPFPPALYFARRLATRIQQRSRATQEALGALGAKVEESLSGQLVIKGLALEDFDRRGFERCAEEFRRLNLGLARARGSLQAMMAGLGALGVLLVLAAGPMAMARDGTSLGQLVAMLFYLQLLAGPTAVLGFVISTLKRGAAALGRLRELLEVVPTLADPARPRPLPSGGGELQVRELTIELENRDGGRRKILDRLSFTVPAGAFVGIVGRTGAGKSVLLRALARKLEVPPGTLFLDGEDYCRLGLADLRGAMAHVAQDPFLFSLSLRENIALGRGDADDGEVLEALRSAGLETDLVQLPEGIDTLVGERGMSLSGGQRQRAALARAILRRPRVLLLDDPFSSVDARSSQQILDSLRPLFRGRTVVLVAHRMATVLAADRVLVLEGGRLVEEGTPEGLLRAGGRFAALYRMQREREALAEDLESGAEAPREGRD